MPITVTGTVRGAGDLLTAGAVPFVSSAGTLGQDATNLVWDNTNKRLGIGTTAPGSKLDVYGTTTAQSFAFAGNSNTWELRGRGTDVATWGVPYFRSTITDSPTSLDVMPNGTGGSEVTGKAWIDICNSDLSPTNSTNFECLVLAARSDSFIVGSHAGGTGSDRSLTLGGSAVAISSKALGGTGYALFNNLGTYISPSGTDRVWFTDGDIRLGSGMDLRWNSGATPYAVALDTGIARNAAGVIEINTGSPGSYGDLQVRSINPTTGNVGIGTTSPSQKLVVSGNAGIGPSNTAPTGTLSILDRTTVTGATLSQIGTDGTNTSATTTKQVIRAGAVQSTTKLTEWQANAGGVLAAVGPGGGFITAATAAETLANSQLTYHIASDTQVTFTLKGSDGVSRTNTLTLS